MKRTIALLLTAGLLAGGLVGTAEAKKKKKPKRIERTVEGGYDAPTLIIVGTCAQTGAVGCVAITTGPGETYLSAVAKDQHGLPVYVAISADTDGNNQDDTSFGSFCGETTEPIPVTEGTELHLWVGAQANTGFAGCVPGIATTGTITATLSNLP